MSERRKRVQCGFCQDWFPAEATRIRAAAGSPCRICIECIEDALFKSRREIRQLLLLDELG